MLSVTPVATTSLMEAVSLGNKPTSWGSEFEWPECSINFLEIRTDGVNFVDDILGTVDSQMSKFLRNEGVIGERDSGSVYLEIASLVDELANSGKGWMSEGAIRSDGS